MTPEKLAFIQGNPVKAKTVEVAAPTEQTKSEQPTEVPPAAIEESRAKSPKRAGRAREERGPEASEVLDQVLVPVTVRLQHRVAQALRRAHLEQRLNHAKPDTQQEIVSEAVSSWLSKHGYLD